MFNCKMIQSYRLMFMTPSSSFGRFKETNINQFLKLRPRSLLLIKEKNKQEKIAHPQKKKGFINDLTFLSLSVNSLIKVLHYAMISQRMT